MISQLIEGGGCLIDVQTKSSNVVTFAKIVECPGGWKDGFDLADD